MTQSPERQIRKKITEFQAYLAQQLAAVRFKKLTFVSAVPHDDGKELEIAFRDAGGKERTFNLRKGSSYWIIDPPSDVDRPFLYAPEDTPEQILASLTGLIRELIADGKL